MLTAFVLFTIAAIAIPLFLAAVIFKFAIHLIVLPFKLLLLPLLIVAVMVKVVVVIAVVAVVFAVLLPLAIVFAIFAAPFFIASALL